MKELTLRQIEILRAIMMTGSVSGAARFLNVTQPGISRALKHIEAGLRISLFIRHGGRLVPAIEARDIFTQLHAVQDKLDALNHTIRRLSSGENVALSIGSVPSIAQAMVPRATASLREMFPDIRISIDILNIEDATDYLMLRKGDFVCVSAELDNASIDLEPLATGGLMCVTDKTHALARREAVGVADIVQFPLIGIDPNDPHGGIITDLFTRHGLDFDTSIQARSGATVIALIRRGLGIGIIDTFTLEAMRDMDSGLAILPIREETSFRTYIARRRDVELSGFAKHFIELLRVAMAKI